MRKSGSRRFAAQNLQRARTSNPLIGVLWQWIPRIAHGRNCRGYLRSSPRLRNTCCN